MFPNKTQDNILFYLKMYGSQTAPSLAKAFSMTGEGMRLHLVKLEESGFVTSSATANGVGRPTLHYTLTDKSHKRFPDNHAALTVQLLANVRSLLGQDALDTLLKAKQKTDFLRYAEALKDAANTQEKLERLTEARTREGYMAELHSTDGGWLFIENHCPICQAATSCNGFCQAEIDTISRLLGEKIQVIRDDHAAHGDRRCTYRIQSAE